MGRRNLDLVRRIFDVVKTMDLDPAKSEGYYLPQFDSTRPESSEENIRDLDGRILGLAVWIKENKKSEDVKCMYFPLIDSKSRPTYTDSTLAIGGSYVRGRNIHTTAGDEEAAARHGPCHYSSVDLGFD